MLLISTQVQRLGKCSEKTTALKKNLLGHNVPHVTISSSFVWGKIRRNYTVRKRLIVINVETGIEKKMRSLISEMIVAQRLRKQYRRASFSFGLSQTIPFSKKQYGFSYNAEVTSSATARVCLIEHATSRQKKPFTRRKHTQKNLNRD